MKSIDKITDNTLFLEKNYYKSITILGILISILWVAIVSTQPFSNFAYIEMKKFRH